MFTGIIESLSEIKEIVEEGDNLSISFYSKITDELKIDQSVSHNGICPVSYTHLTLPTICSV